MSEKTKGFFLRTKQLRCFVRQKIINILSNRVNEILNSPVIPSNNPSEKGNGSGLLEADNSTTETDFSGTGKLKPEEIARRQKEKDKKIQIDKENMGAIQNEKARIEKEEKGGQNNEVVLSLGKKPRVFSDTNWKF